MSRKLASLFTAIAIAATMIPTASAEPTRRIVKVSVSYSDLNLSRVEGAKALSVRIDNAIDKACGRKAGRVPLVLARSIEGCRTQALEQALAAINAPMLTALYRTDEGTQYAGR